MREGRTPKGGVCLFGDLGKTHVTEIDIGLHHRGDSVADNHAEPRIRVLVDALKSGIRCLGVPGVENWNWIHSSPLASCTPPYQGNLKDRTDADRHCQFRYTAEKRVWVGLARQPLVSEQVSSVMARENQNLGRSIRMSERRRFTRGERGVQPDPIANIAYGLPESPRHDSGADVWKRLGKKVRRTKRCSSCRIELPLTGQCDTCE